MRFIQSMNEDRFINLNHIVDFEIIEELEGYYFNANTINKEDISIYWLSLEEEGNMITLDTAKYILHHLIKDITEYKINFISSDYICDKVDDYLKKIYK